NGGLFDPQQHPFLTQKAVGDRALGQAIDLLSRRETEEGREFVDYRSLGVRHLGSIYEGLLEYQPQRPLRSQKTLKVSIAADKGERKATGSYYTPQYIVAYIVEHTLGPLVEEAKEKANLRMSESANGESANGQAFVDAILDLKVLDPAMGSGHFLVEATDFLALALATDPHVETGTPAEEDLTYWKRRVVERCIYGVDKNPLAVELAKLSLWLATVAAEKPLSFLDHHLKCGDSLVGARVDDLGESPPVMLGKKVLKERRARYEAGARQANLFEMRLTEKLPVVMGRILEITEVESVDYDTVRAKEAADRAVQELKLPFEAVADLWTSAYFGNEFINGEYDEALMNIGQPDALLALPAVQRARAMADERHFFHWELAFPEVFYDQHGQRLGERAGFDAVVGNPPYSPISGKQLRKYFSYSFESPEYQYDTFVLFIEKGVTLLGSAGYTSMIVPTTFMVEHYYSKIRAFLLSRTAILRLLHFRYPVFEDATVESAIYVATRLSSGKKHPDKIGMAFVYRGDSIRRNQLTYETVSQNLLASLPGQDMNVHIAGARASVMTKLLTNKTVLFESTAEITVGVKPYQTGKGNPKQAKEDVELRVYDATHRKDNTYRQYLVGSNIDRFELNPSPDQWLSYGDWLAEPRRSAPFDAKAKILIRQTGDSIIATIDRDQYLTLNNLHNVAITDDRFSYEYVLAILNSAVVNFFHQTNVPEKGRTFAEVKTVDLGVIPIPRIEFTTPAGEREQLAAKAKAKTEESIEALMASGALGSDTPLDRAMLAQAALPALGFVEERLATGLEQADVVHDLLAHLAERMSEMNKQKQARTEDFWLDLEGVTDVETFETLRHKGKWERTLWRKSEVYRPFVDEESRSTRHLDESLTWNEDAFKLFVKVLAGKVQGLSGLVKVYRAHSPAYRELAARITAADWLIDQLVYKLYGLAEEEIAIVEGA
ncbi:MAG: TaqI-like C-terminal specificity domain-containing protein, partial [Chloroflexota bacterium]|nr:TaqI-like C-terminal specificity domain-containing protein [Chloroflexota bacterium]